MITRDPYMLFCAIPLDNGIHARTFLCQDVALDNGVRSSAPPRLKTWATRATWATWSSGFRAALVTETKP
jgi:hypothetical protein